MSTTEEKIQAAKQSVLLKPPTVPVWLDLARASDSELQALVDACQPATFGRNQEDVLDETYRKARKMDLEYFTPKLNLEKYRILDRIRAQMLEGLDEKRTIRSELYKLNVYDKGSFFKSHQDTPRGTDMFGSLVIVFPTQHEGGKLLLRHRGEEWSFDSATAVSQQDEPSFGYVAFYSDVEHEVTTVDVGSPPLPASVVPVVPDDSRLKSAISDLLNDPNFLPKGGFLGFGCIRQNPQEMKDSLKGCDAVIKNVCEQLSLTVSLGAIYELEGKRLDRNYHSPPPRVKVMLDQVPNLAEWHVDDDLFTTFRRSLRSVIVYNAGSPIPADWNYEVARGSAALEVVWITELNTLVRCRTDYMAFGNEASAEHTYCDLSLMAEVGKPGERNKSPRPVPKKRRVGRS
ncbi:hypothetical protein BD779DRAFT_1609373 [Infundibulicybe gibba]|nr:hypothetical protein BD779DRAFT_1609373 [Infundibulicybe gibba]